jgi:hypothetical protein
MRSLTGSMKRALPTLGSVPYITSHRSTPLTQSRTGIFLFQHKVGLPPLSLKLLLGKPHTPIDTPSTNGNLWMV